MKNDNRETMFVCHFTDHPDITATYERMRLVQKQTDERLEFLKKQADDCQEEVQKMWTELFHTCQRVGKIPLSYKREDWGMHIVNNGKQLLISPKVDGPPMGHIMQINL